MSRAFRALKITAVPLLFAAAALGLATVHISAERRAARANAHAGHTVAVQDANLPGGLAGLKLQTLAPAAKSGDVSAEFEMARRLALGEGVKKNEAQAASYFQSVVSQLGDIGAHDKRAPLAATAYRFLAQFHRRGVAEAHIAANPAYAFDLLHHAASYFGDAAAQYELAKAFIEGDGVSKNARAGTNWMKLAAKKGYAPAQALLGDKLWRGDGVKRVPGEGLGMLAIARRNASPADKVWVSKMFEAARAEALPIEILAANAYIVQESGASPFTAPALGMADEDLQDSGDSGAKGVAAPVQPIGARQGSVVHRSSHLLPGLRANPMVAGLDASDRDLTAMKAKSKASAGIIQMYRLAAQQGSSENLTPVRLADVAK